MFLVVFSISIRGVLRDHTGGTVTLTERVRALFLSRPGEWIDGRDLANVGGYAAWRTRVSNCREKFAMQIENAQEVREHLTISRYRYTPADLCEIANNPDPRD